MTKLESLKIEADALIKKLNTLHPEEKVLIKSLPSYKSLKTFLIGNSSYFRTELKNIIRAGEFKKIMRKLGYEVDVDYNAKLDKVIVTAYSCSSMDLNNYWD